MSAQRTLVSHNLLNLGTWLSALGQTGRTISRWLVASEESRKVAQKARCQHKLFSYKNIFLF